MTTEQLTAVIDAALSDLYLSNSSEPGGTATDTAERGAIIALEALRSQLTEALS